MSSAKLPLTIDHDAVFERPWDAEVPRAIWKHVIAGILLVAISFGSFGYWAFSAPLAAAIMAPGSFVATGRNKMVQHLGGGIIAEMYVAEGDKVTSGEPLVRLDETTALANQRALFLRRVRLEAIEARIMSEYEAKPELVFPEWLGEARSDPEIATMLDSQTLSFEVARSQLENDIGLIERNIAVLDSREKGYRIQRRSMEQQIELLSEDRDSKLVLVEKALIRRSEYNTLLRAVADAEGQLGRIDAEISESIELRAKYQAQTRQVIDTYRQAALDELETVQIELDTVREQERGAQSTLRRVVINAPVSGTVVRLNYAGVGGVVEGGKVIAEILPTDVPLIIETMIARTDIDSVKIGQQASVRLTALNARTTPILMGEVFYVSADAIVDDDSGAPREVYVARVKIPIQELDRIPGFAPVPGMPVLVMIQTAERTFAQYLVKPIADSMQRAFREQ